MPNTLAFAADSGLYSCGVPLLRAAALLQLPRTHGWTRSLLKTAEVGASLSLNQYSILSFYSTFGFSLGSSLPLSVLLACSSLSSRIRCLCWYCHVVDVIFSPSTARWAAHVWWWFTRSLTADAPTYIACLCYANARVALAGGGHSPFRPLLLVCR